MSQRGKRAALVAALLFLGALCLSVALLPVLGRWRDSREAGEMEGRNRTFAVGEWAVLDSAEDERPLAFGGSYEAHFGWSGRLDLRVRSAELVAGDDALLGSLDEDRWFPDALSEDGDKSCLVVSLDVRNVSAIPEASTKTGRRWLNISFLNVADGGGSLVYFDGSPEEALDDLGEYMYFDLGQGESGSYTLVYRIGDGVERRSLALCAGYANLPNKYRFELWG